MKTVAFYTLGCKVNQYESEAMAELFEKDGYKISDFDDVCDVYVINTCTVTSISDRKSRKAIRAAKKKNPNSIVAVTGCYAQVAADEIGKIDGVNLIVGTNNRSKIVNLVNSVNPSAVTSCVDDISNDRTFETLKINGYQNRTRAFIKIQEGCNQFCTYCIIPYARGPVRSRNKDEIIDEVKVLASSGYREIILTGIHIASYHDLPGYGLAELICDINKIDGIKRIRLGSLEPMVLSPKFTEKIKGCDKLCRHFHLALQSGCDKTLERMNRKYTTAQYEAIVNSIRNIFPGSAVTTDIMVGFPEETDEEFNETAYFVQKINFSDSHIFEYSIRQGTPAAKMKQISPNVKHERSKVIEKITSKSREQYLDWHIGKTLNILIEREVSPGIYEGKTDNYITVFTPSEHDITDEFTDVFIEKRDGAVLIGTIK